MTSPLPASVTPQESPYKPYQPAEYNSYGTVRIVSSGSGNQGGYTSSTSQNYTQGQGEVLRSDRPAERVSESNQAQRLSNQMTVT